MKYQLVTVNRETALHTVRDDEYIVPNDQYVFLGNDGKQYIVDSINAWGTGSDEFHESYVDDTKDFANWLVRLGIDIAREEMNWNVLNDLIYLYSNDPNDQRYQQVKQSLEGQNA